MSDNNTQPAQDTPTAGDKLYDGAASDGKKVDSKANESAPATDQSAAPAQEQKQDAAPAAGDAKTDEVEYDLQLPEKTNLSTDDVDKIVAVAKAQGLSKDDAQKLLDMQHEAVSQFETEKLDEFKQTVEAWKSQASTDPEYGGDNFARNVELAKRVISRFSNNDFVQALDASGFGNHPELLRTFVRIGQAMGEDQLVTNKPTGSQSKSFEELFYGNNKT